MRILSQLALSAFALWAGMQAAQAAVDEQYVKDLWCLARVVYAEARDQPLQAQRDVAHSVMNRVAANRRDFGGNTVCGVVYYSTRRANGTVVRQYSGITSEPWRPKEWNCWFTSLTVAHEVLTEKVIPEGGMREALYYLDPRYSSLSNKEWFERNLRPLVWSGAHHFYGEKIAKR